MSLVPVLAIMLGSCSKEHSTADGGSQSTTTTVQIAPPAGAVPFKGQVYRAFDDSKVITLTSADEMELSENGVNLICKYVKQDNNTLRVVANVNGTMQALYFQFNLQGLLASDRTQLLSPEFY